MKLEAGTRAIVTGAGSGLGRELCLQLARKGARVWATDLDAKAAQSAAEECLREGAAEARAFACDVSRPEDLDRLAKLARDTWGGVDLLVNNAGVAHAAPLEKHTLEDWRWVLDTNLKGVIHGCHAFFPMMREADRGAILNIASSAGLLSPPKMAAYNVSKAGVIALSETIRAECMDTGVQVSVACPAFFRSGLFDKSRFSDDEIRGVARKLFQKGAPSAAGVARACLRAVEARRFYVVPTWDARLLWALKRILPVAVARAFNIVFPRIAEQVRREEATP